MKVRYPGLADQYSRAVYTLDAMKLFGINVQHSRVDVGWQQGSATAGYKELAAAISEVVSDRWDELRNEAIARAEKKVEQAHENLVTGLTETDDRGTP